MATEEGKQLRVADGDLFVGSIESDIGAVTSNKSAKTVTGDEISEVVGNRQPVTFRVISDDCRECP